MLSLFDLGESELGMLDCRTEASRVDSRFGSHGRDDQGVADASVEGPEAASPRSGT